MLRYMFFISLLSISGSLYPMNYSKPTLKTTFKGKNSLEIEPQAASVVRFIGSNGKFDSATIGNGQLSLNHFKLLDEKYPLAKHNLCNNGTSKESSLKVAARLLYASPDEWKERFFPYLGLKVVQEQDKFKELTLRQAILDYSMTTKLNENRLLESSFGDIFMKPSDDLNVLYHLDRYFVSTGRTNIRITDGQLDRIKKLTPEDKQAFRNNDKFFSYQLVRTPQQAVRYIGQETLRGAVKGALIGGTAALCIQYGYRIGMPPATLFFLTAGMNLLQQEVALAGSLLYLEIPQKAGFDAGAKSFLETLGNDKSYASAAKAGLHGYKEGFVDSLSEASKWLIDDNAAERKGLSEASKLFVKQGMYPPLHQSKIYKLLSPPNNAFYGAIIGGGFGLIEAINTVGRPTETGLISQS